jgi:hypothetical protein
VKFEFPEYGEQESPGKLPEVKPLFTLACWAASQDMGRLGMSRFEADVAK